MKRSFLLLCTFFFAILVYVVFGVTLALNTVIAVWLSLALLIPVIPAVMIGAFSFRSTSLPFQIKISAIVASMIYSIAAVILCMLGMLFMLPFGLLFGINTAFFMMYCAVLLLLFISGKYIFKVENAVINRVIEEKTLRYEFDGVKLKTSKLNPSISREAAHIIDSIIEEIRFSDFDSKTDVTDIDDSLHRSAQMLSAEIDNMIAIDSTDLESLNAIADDAISLVKSRNMQVRIVKDSI